MQPLAERMRPSLLEDYIGQEHLMGPQGPLRRAIDAGHLPSCILWGPPGVGKTTLAALLATALKRTIYTLSAVSSGVKEVRETLELAKKNRMFEANSPILFIDEIHRFSKSQQDSLLGAVEKGIVTLIGATTENPSFEVISALLSRCQVYVLQPLLESHMVHMLQKAIQVDPLFKGKEITLEETDALYHFSGGDGRKLYNLFELLVSSANSNTLNITNALVTERLQKNLALYDKDGEQHYDIISAFIKSIRGSDANAAVYWLARMLQGGESLEFIGRRLLILASEDIGLANPNALLLAQACFDSIRVIGNPESRIILSQAVIYLANSPKSNSAYLAIDEALAFVEKTGNLPVPLHLRNAPTKLMKELNYGADYKYPHNYPGHWVAQNYMPEWDGIPTFYQPAQNPAEDKMRPKNAKKED
ncbi:replication-associated recombination protein A [Aquirufa ecclesiirivi]|uniref:Replication-associated recombination protein A n=1 Tax=Aquirufa ecclesiirivi TaxID=2715124 RepID=A0ABT4JGE8_9BACT|nr:replication-associated recombination protein A [Aquirufa ecclesiirivi]MCZ2475353.1 replication-associated recombination protein A [Aquirufa ecclesiirivi]NHC49697.1 replication-associated recombination protein A [Aquirufa ecclesiirivi]